MYILGISAFYHDSAAALVRDGEIVAAGQEERFTRKKHDASFPVNACRYCLREAGISASQLDQVVFYEKPLLKFERLLETYLSYAPVGFRSFSHAVPLWLKEKLFLPGILDKGLDGQFHKRYIFAEHHESHAASAFFPSPFEEAAIVTVDGVGEWATTTIGEGNGNQLKITHQLSFPHSLGLLYSAFTYYTGFKVNSGEYKLMGLAPYGEPVYAERIRKVLVDLKKDGSFRLNMQYFNYCQGLTMTNRRFHDLFGQLPRKPESPITQFHMDVAASIQKVTEEMMLAIAREAHRLTGSQNLCLAGGVALNCVANGLISRKGPFEQIWIQPASGDAGGALGAALFVWYQLLKNPRATHSPDAQGGSLLGPSYTPTEIKTFLESTGAVFHMLSDEREFYERVTALIDARLVVGWFQGRMEFGPRALGARSILADARSQQMQKTVNLRIKFRESFRPFAPAVLSTSAGEFFEIGSAETSPYMLRVFEVKSEQRLVERARVEKEKGLAKLALHRSTIPAVTHVDFSARLQTVDRRHERLEQLLIQFQKKTGCPVLVNTSFNVRGEPIVCSPEDAYRCFMATEMDALVMENMLLLKQEQPANKRIRIEDHVTNFELD